MRFLVSARVNAVSTNLDFNLHQGQYQKGIVVQVVADAVKKHIPIGFVKKEKLKKVSGVSFAGIEPCSFLCVVSSVDHEVNTAPRLIESNSINIVLHVTPLFS